jgi:hypothetical protein
MPETHRRLTLRCDLLNSQFTLAEEGGDLRKTFESFEDAYEDAESRATATTPLILYNQRGGVILETTISPLDQELLSARSHWRNVAALEERPANVALHS